jgi:hypothetical protein
MLNADGCGHVGARGCRELGTEVGDEVEKKTRYAEVTQTRRPAGGGRSPIRCSRGLAGGRNVLALA